MPIVSFLQLNPSCFKRKKNRVSVHWFINVKDELKWLVRKNNSSREKYCLEQYVTNITYTTQTAPYTGIAAGHKKLQSHAQSPLRKNTGVGFLQTWNGRLNLLWFHYIFSFRDWYLGCWWGASLSLSCPYSYPLEETGPEETLQVKRDDRTQCQFNQKFYFLKNNIRRKNVSLLLLKVLPPCWVPAASPCSHILSVLVSSCSSGFFFFGTVKTCLHIFWAK